MVSNLVSLGIRVALLVPLTGALFLMYPETGYACSCVPSGSPSEELAKFATVFQGRVVSVRDLPRGEGTPESRGQLNVEFDVETVWKGNVNQPMNLTTNIDTAACGVSFVKGVTYIVYSEGDSTVHRCSRTRPLSEATEDLAELGQGQPPTQGTASSASDTPQSPSDESTTSGGCGTSPHTTDLSIVGLVFGTVLLGLRRQRSVRT